MGHGHAVQLRIGEGVYQVGLEPVLVVVVPVEGLLELARRIVPIGLGHQPLDARLLPRLLDLRLIPISNFEETSRRHFVRI